MLHEVKEGYDDEILFRRSVTSPLKSDRLENWDEEVLLVQSVTFASPPKSLAMK